MKKNPKIIFFVTAFFAVAVLTNHAFAQDKQTAPAKSKIETAPPAPVSLDNSSQIDFLGTFDGGVYKNKFFGLKIAVPEKWLIQESEVNRAIRQRGAELVKGKNEQIEKQVQESRQRLTLLFTVSRDILGLENNALMSFSSEKMPALVQVRNGEDYLRLNLQSFKKLVLPPDFKYSETINSEKFGNEMFYSLDFQRNGYKQRIYATARKGYALFFTLSYAADEDLETMKAVIRNSDFSWKE